MNEQPEGNNFPQPADLQRLYERAGFTVADDVMLGDLPSPPQHWVDQEAAITNWIDEHHRGERAWRRSVAQESVISHLLSTGAVIGRLSLLARREPRGPG